MELLVFGVVLLDLLLVFLHVDFQSDEEVVFEGIGKAGFAYE